MRKAVEQIKKMLFVDSSIPASKRFNSCQSSRCPVHRECQAAVLGETNGVCSCFAEVWRSFTNSRSHQRAQQPHTMAVYGMSHNNNNDNNNNNNNNDNNNDNNNNNSNRIQRRYSRFFTISSQLREPFPTRTLKWPGRNRVQITCNTLSAYHVQVSCYVPLGTKRQISY